MYVGRDFDVSDTQEDEVYSFDFVNELLDAGEIINSAIFEIKVARSSPVNDPAINTRMLGSPAVNGTIASQRLAALVERCVYFLRAKCATSTGNVRSLHAYIRVAEQR
jgi:hypothetical protein